MLLVNPHAKVPPPPWIADAIHIAGEEYERVLAPIKPNVPRAYSVHKIEFRVQ
jgi:hypothetical protein